MASRARHPDRREDALSQERIIEAAVEMLDAGGESALTFRALSATLKTGPGAIYWHVANKGELLTAAADAVLTGAMPATGAGEVPQDVIRAVALGVFDAIEAHPWIGEQMSQLSSQSTTLRIFERLGRQVQALGVPGPAQFDAASALLNYILGVAAQNAAMARSVQRGTDRAEVLDLVASLWTSLDTDEYPFLRNIAAQLRDHDDRAQFLAGVDLILAGIASRYPPA
ncbi:TetR/AcrR family transcriptional regulator C-terminal domain-containing protein [Actinoplanes oblitus]|uniref:TetR/AcrR family transcriptional regulator C-terminal domain-containing protein n=1 Tax=Actinoplanes oblitus TaxID=3040509 RepID=A0ABY8WS71_9ACTN|nr:TetR/AcrR family transcriptional regulator C-terminal domain-containing protein [Actinoplanes oblitus]WIM99710.1 TetR/AcrR family transcriptional regulator C-terminal domain-containing protein [Actinoplanes oblitus]